MIVSATEIKQNEYVLIETYKQYMYDLFKGSIVKVTKFDGSNLTFKFVPNDAGLKKSTQQLIQNKLKDEKINLKHLKAGLALWISEPEKFVYEERRGFGEHWWHVDGKICEYCYLETLGYFFPKDDFEKMITETEQTIAEYKSGAKDKYFEKIVADHKNVFTVEQFNIYFQEK